MFADIGFWIFSDYAVSTVLKLAVTLVVIPTTSLILVYLFLFKMMAFMLTCGQLAPRETAWTFERNEKVSLTPWRLTIPVSATLLAMVIALYLLFSPIGLADGRLGGWYWSLNGLLGSVVAFTWLKVRRGSLMQD